MEKFGTGIIQNGSAKTVDDDNTPGTKMGKLPKLRLRDLIAALKVFQPCCFPAVSPRKLSSSSRRTSMVKARSRAPSVAVYSIKTACGRLNALKEANTEALEVFLPVKDEIIARLIEHEEDDAKSVLGKDSGEVINLTIVSYKTQSGLGTNYFLKMRVNDGPVYLHARIYQPVDGEPFLTELSYNKSENDEIEYF